MGYTHRWVQARAFTATEWHDICSDVRRLIETAAKQAVNVTRDSDLGEPAEISDEVIRFNGYDRQGYETFILTKERWPHLPGADPGENFCKTEHKAYDVVVTALLAYLEDNFPGVIKVNSDGEAKEWQKGIALCKAAWSGSRIKAPEAVRGELRNEQRQAP